MKRGGIEEIKKEDRQDKKKAETISFVFQFYPDIIYRDENQHVKENPI